MQLSGLRTQWSTYLKKFNSFGSPLRILLSTATVVLAAIIVFWLFNQIFYYYIARSYAEEIADAYDLNQGFTNAVIWASFAAVVVLAGLVFSFSKRKRWIGFAGLLTLLIAHSVAIGSLNRNFERQGKSARCYVLTRDSVKISNRLGIDSETGRECRPLTPAMVERIDEYQKGKRPALISSDDPAFFSPLSGEPIVWYAKRATGEIELFDLMGFHPQTGEELQPVNKDIAAGWRAQNSKVVKKAPSRIDPERYGFFNPVTGNAKVWFWRDEAGNYEFYDGPGFQPRTGDALQIVTKESIAEWKQSLANAAARKRAEEEQREKDIRTAKELAEQAKRQQAEADRLAAQAQAEALQKQIQSANDCDALGANPTDIRRKAAGVPFDVLKLQADRAYEACKRAVQFYPNEPRLLYQLGRAAKFKNKSEAFEIFTKLVNVNYPAAFDNLGGMYLYDRKDLAKAVQLFRTGASLNDADSMASLADLVDRGLFGQSNPDAVKWVLLQRAAELGHVGAQRAISEHQENMQRAASDAAIQQEAARNAAAVIGTILQGVGRR